MNIERTSVLILKRYKYQILYRFQPLVYPLQARAAVLLRYLLEIVGIFGCYLHENIILLRELQLSV